MPNVRRVRRQRVALGVDLLFGVAVILALAGAITLFVGIAVALARWIGPLGGAIASMLLAAGIAGLFAWLALRDLKEGLEMVEEKARSELGMVKPNEIFVNVSK